MKLSTLLFALTTAVVAFGAVASSPERARAAFPGTNGKIAFTSTRDGGGHEVYVMNADGSGQTRLTQNDGNNLAPAWSPDGSKIAWRGATVDVYVMNADGTGQTNLTNGTLFATSAAPSWSPDGSKIAYMRRDENLEIYVMNADGSGQTRLTQNADDDEDPAWSPDGAKIAFSSARDGDFEIYVMNPDGSGQTRLTQSASTDINVSWSPDGSKIAFRSERDGNSEIYIMNADGSGQMNLSQNAAADTLPAWSPDGGKIAFASNRDGNFEIYVMNADGSGQTRLTDNSAVDIYPDWQTIPAPDSDGDGIPDDEDVEHIQTAVAGLSASAFKSGDPGHANAIRNALDDVEAAVAAGNTQLALDRLRSLRKRIDGCGTNADKTDWIVDCAAQLQIRELVDELIANLSS